MMFANPNLNNAFFPRDRLYMHNFDLDFISHHLDECRGPTHVTYAFNVLNTYRIRNLPRSQYFRTDIPKKILMHGVTHDIVVKTLRDGFDHKGCSKSVFGENYYFTPCSTKAANYSLPFAWDYEARADSGSEKHQPKPGDIGYIIYCIVATGNSMYVEKRMKRLNWNLVGNYDSIIFRGIYELVGEENIDCGNIEAKLGRSPFRDSCKVSKKSKQDSMFYDEICVGTADKVLPFVLAEVRYE